MSVERLKNALATARDVVVALDPAVLDASTASQLVDTFAELERVSSAGRTIAGRAVEKSLLWAQEGHRSPAHWMAAHAQTTVAAAVTTLETGRQLEKLPATVQAFKAGELSAFQAAEISRAATLDPAAETTLLNAAASESVAGLRERCRSVIAAASDDEASDERIHRKRYLRHWTDADGSLRLDACLAPDSGARLITTIEARARRFLEQAKRAGSRESAHAYAADALVSLLDDGPGPRAVVHVHVDEPAWKRGWVERGEVCRISGVGSVSVAAARRLAADGEIKAVLAGDRGDVRAVAHFGRTIPARVRTALEARDQTCVVPECDERLDLEIDHIVPLAEGGATRLENLARLCRWHHGLKTHRGWRLSGGPGAWRFFKPKREATRSPP